MREVLCFGCLLLLVAGLATSPARAGAEGSPDHAEVRLIDGGPLGDGPNRLAGLQIRLDPQWKTYWRTPGDSGIPPSFDFSGSDNVAEVTVEWPAPEVFFDGYGWVIGYASEVILPLVVVPQDPGKPVGLHLDLTFAVCKDICLPAEADATVSLDGSAPRTAAIGYYRDRVPVPIEGPGGSLGVSSAPLVSGQGAGVLELHLKFPSGAADAYALIEGPPDWYLPVPERTGTDADGAAVFRVPLDGAPDPAAVSGATLLVTGISPDFAFEQQITLD